MRSFGVTGMPLNEHALDVGAAVRVDTGMRVLGARRDLKGAPVPIDQHVQGGRRVVREHGVTAARLHGREEVTLHRNVGVPPSEDTPVQGVEDPPGDPRLDRLGTHAAGAQVGEVDDAPLPCGESGGREIGSGRFSPLWGEN